MSGPVETLLCVRQTEKLSGDGGVGSRHDDAGQDEHNDQHVELEQSPVTLHIFHPIQDLKKSHILPRLPSLEYTKSKIRQLCFQFGDVSVQYGVQIVSQMVPGSV